MTVPAGAALRALVVEGDRVAQSCESGMKPTLRLRDASGTIVAYGAAYRGQCNAIDGTGAAPLHPAARNTSSQAQTYYLEVASTTTATSGAFRYALQVTIR